MSVSSMSEFEPANKYADAPFPKRFNASDLAFLIYPNLQLSRMSRKFPILALRRCIHARNNDCIEKEMKSGGYSAKYVGDRRAMRVYSH
jgi:hypothetical protein